MAPGSVVEIEVARQPWSIVLDYVMDDRALVESERSMFAIFELDKWGPRIYQFVLSAASARAVRAPG